MVMQKTHDGNYREYPVDPEELAAKLRTIQPADTGFIKPNSGVIFVSSKGKSRVVAAYRPPQITGIWLEGSETALRVPMPGLVVMKHLPTGSTNVVALAGEPELEAQLYDAPVANVSGAHGHVCWGTVSVPVIPEDSTDLRPLWDAFFGTRFANHGTARKSLKHPSDVRSMLIQLHDSGAKKYPVEDLVPLSTQTETVTLAKLLKYGRGSV